LLVLVLFPAEAGLHPPTGRAVSHESPDDALKRMKNWITILPQETVFRNIRRFLFASCETSN
jgi:hypothetical protein